MLDVDASILCSKLIYSGQTRCRCGYSIPIADQDCRGTQAQNNSFRINHIPGVS